MSPPSNDAQQQQQHDDDPQSQPRPPPRSLNPRSFDLEPNPFEQSFKRSSSSPNSSEVPLKNNSDDTANNSTAPANINSNTNPNTNPSTNPKPKPEHEQNNKPVLPSLAALSSPSDGYSWTDLTSSLRSGPLSPAMLQGPQQPQQQSSNLSLNGYDPTRAFGRTGLTPSTGLTPLVGGPVSFPPPSPNTAAFLAMVTNQSSTSQLNPAPATITPNTLSAITGMLNPSQTQHSNSSSLPAHAPHHQQSHGMSVSHLPSQGYQYGNNQQPNGYAPGTAANAANGLFLLSQAHQELTKREEAQARADANAGTRRKRKSIDGPPPPIVSTSSRAPIKKPRTNGGRTSKRGKSTADEDDSMDDDDGQDDDGGSVQANGSKKPETEEEKRRNFLERNRQAALKCRQRKKAWLAQLQAKVEFLQNENDRLTNALVSSREEISRLNALLGTQPPVAVSSVNSQPVSVSVSLPGAAKSVPAPVSVSNGRGYGY
ncbi:hypothetical protein BU17DRAFT_36739 [Hysterangium stoloniferum]|nr:hypothetical protein BU17DRAFT_36739 [Hysterangium stoloniferum]